MRHMKILSLTLLLTLALTFAACAAPTTPAPTTAPEDSPTPLATITSPPTWTPPPTLTPIRPTATEVPPPTDTPVPTLDPVFSDVKLIALAWFDNYDLLLGFQFPTSVDVNAADYRVTLEDKEYKCEVTTQFPHRLYCRGQGAKVLAVATVRLYPVGSDLPGFEKEIWVPFFPSN